MISGWGLRGKLSAPSGRVVSIFHVPQLLHDDTFRRLCRGRDPARQRIPISHSAGAGGARKPVFPNFISIDYSALLSARPPHDFLTRLRMNRAKQMLASERTVTEVCFEIGYGSLGSSSPANSVHNSAAVPPNFSAKSAASSATALHGAC